MAQQVVLEVTPRTATGHAVKKLRREGIVPANVYGHKETPTPIQIDAMTFDRLRRGHGTRNIITLRFADAPAQTALVKHVQKDPITDQILHIDFARVNVRERLEMKIPLNFVGDAPGVKIEGGVFLHLVDALTVECEAADMVDHLDVDISSLTGFDSVLHASDVKLPAKYDLITDPEEPIAKVDPPRVEVPGTPTTEEAAATAPVEESTAAETSEEESE